MDHGHGISSIYSHLEKVMVNVGDEINKVRLLEQLGQQEGQLDHI